MMPHHSTTTSARDYSILKDVQEQENPEADRGGTRTPQFRGGAESVSASRQVPLLRIQVAQKAPLSLAAQSITVCVHGRYGRSLQRSDMVHVLIKICPL